MAVSDSIKVDLLLKKLYGVAKTDTSTNKSPSNEAITSPLLIRGDTIWTQANSIPTTAATLAGVVQSYLTTSRIQCVADTTTQRIGGTVYPTWRTNLTNWIPTEFDTVNLTNSYRVRVYYGTAGLSDPATTGGTQIFADGSGGTGEWYFDYQSGVLNLIGGTIPTGMTAASVIYIYGYRYVGSTTVNTLQPPINSNISLTTTGTGLVQINSDSITTDRTAFNLINTTATTVNAFGAATTLNIGASSGILTIGNAAITGTNATSFAMNGASPSITTSNTGTASVFNTSALTGNLFGAATTVNIGNATAATVTLRPGTLVGSNITQNLYNTVATTVNAFGAATAVNIGAATGTFTVNNQQTVFNSTDSIQIPVGTTAQRDASPVQGQIRYNTTLSSFEGYGPGTAWGSLGGVKDVDGNTYIIAEFTPAANDNTLWFYNNEVQTLTITQTNVEFQSPVIVTINNTTDSTLPTNGALVVDGGIGVAKSIIGGGFATNPTTGALTTITSSLQSFVIDEGIY